MHMHTSWGRWDCGPGGGEEAAVTSQLSFWKLWRFWRKSLVIWAKTLRRKHSSAVCVISKTHWLHLHLTNSCVVRRLHGVHRRVVLQWNFTLSNSILLRRLSRILRLLQRVYLEPSMALLLICRSLASTYCSSHASNAPNGAWFY